MNERIKALRLALGLTLDSFGERIGIGKSSVSKIEKGVNGTTDQTIKSICREFNVNETWLRTGEGEMFRQDGQSILDRMSAEYSLSPRECAVISAFCELDSADRAAIMRYVDHLVDKLSPSSAAIDDATAAGIAAMQDYARMVDKEKEAEESSSTSAG